MKKLFIVLIGLSLSSLHAQETKFNIELEQENCAKKSPAFQTPLMGTFKPVDYKVQYQPELENQTMPNKEEGMSAKELEKQRITANKKTYFNPNGEQANANKTGDINTISIRKKFEGNNNSGCPPDNTIAISRDGLIFSGTNNGIRIYNDTGALKRTWNLWNFVNNSSLTTNLCDPKVLYDDIADRFVFYTQTCDFPNPSKVVLGFSKTNDPAGEWWIYTLTGDPLGLGNLFDYPKMALTANEVILTGNLFQSSNNTFSEVVIYQLNKADGFAGRTLNWQFWTDVADAPFTLMPMRNGLGGNYGNSCHLISLRSSNGNTVNVYTLTDQMSASNEKINLKKITIDNYSIMGNSSQSGTTSKLHTGDCRVLDGYFQSPILHFVHNVSDNGWSSVRYYRYNLFTSVGSYKTITSAGSRDFAYASVSPLNNGGGDQSSLVSFLSSGPAIFPEVRAKYFDNSFNSNTSFLVRAGDKGVSTCFDTDKNSDRWGDYSGSCIRPGSDVPSVWISGCYGNNTARWNTYIAEITDSFPLNIPSAVTTPNATDKNKAMSVYPNPSTELVSVEFTCNKTEKMNFEIYNAAGKLVDNIMNAYCNIGVNKFTFATNTLADGVYFLRIHDDHQSLLNEKFVVKHP